MIRPRFAKGEKELTEGAETLRLAAAAVTEADLAAGKLVPTREFPAVTAQAEETALRLLDRAAKEAEDAEHTAAAFVGRPGAKHLVEPLRTHAASIARLRTQAAEFAAFTRRMASLPDAEELESSESRSPQVSTAGRREPRTRKPNATYFGADWSS
ncbi:hypothetical protein ZWY2020_055983 [Hordeum vulgare]|nr:hypothetical protein ZWY2020_055983 [Hordeum vulgare]